jgi:hypothetical protein
VIVCVDLESEKRSSRPIAPLRPTARRGDRDQGCVDTSGSDLRFNLSAATMLALDSDRTQLIWNA